MWSMKYWWLRLIQQRIFIFRPCFLCPHSRFSHAATGCVKCENCQAKPEDIDQIYAQCGGKLL